LPTVTRGRATDRTSLVVVGGIGRVLIGAGVLILLFVAYQLWGTSLQTARAQDDLAEEFDRRLAEAAPTTTAPPTSTSEGSPPTSIVPSPPAPSVAPAELGDPAGRIEIDRIGLDAVFVEGVRVRDLKDGPGHYPSTPLPGQAGNAAIAGHRTTYAAPFNRLDELEPGDEILITTLQGRFVYAVRESFVVRPSQNEVLAPTTDNRLTLTSCHPEYSARQRLIVVADLRGQPVEVPSPPAGEVDGGSEPPDDSSASEGLDVSGESAPRLPAVLWAAVCAAIAVAVWLLARLWRRMRGLVYGVGTAVFLVALFVFFENFSRLLPANF
jgi:sortase A